jgi:transposase
VGVDDWAWRKGQRYGTIVVGLEWSEVIDLLPDRDAQTVAAWLKAHPGVEMVSRDRSAGYAQAATEGASRAEQVADRWHLLKNLREAVALVLHSAVVDEALKARCCRAISPDCPARCTRRRCRRRVAVRRG